jgi:hypothetical protein
MRDTQAKNIGGRTTGKAANGFRDYFGVRIFRRSTK